jgi:hypothetical protein
MALNGQNVCDTVAFRIANRLPANGTGAGSIIECANQALGLISSAGSWVWDQTSLAGYPLVSDMATLSPSGDIGKEIACFNLSNGTRIERAKNSDRLSASTGYINTSSTLYNTFYLFSQAGTGGDPFVMFYPSYGNTGYSFVAITYHLTPTVLTYGVSPAVRWTITAMDQLLIDLTEAIVKRVLGLAGWDVMYADCVKRIGEFRVTYSSQRENTGPDSESDISAKEKQTGRD